MKNIGGLHPTKGEIELEQRCLKCRESLRQWQRDYERLKVARHQQMDMQQFPLRHNLVAAGSLGFGVTQPKTYNISGNIHMVTQIPREYSPQFCYTRPDSSTYAVRKPFSRNEFNGHFPTGGIMRSSTNYTKPHVQFRDDVDFDKKWQTNSNYRASGQTTSHYAKPYSTQPSLRTTQSIDSSSTQNSQVHRIWEQSSGSRTESNNITHQFTAKNLHGPSINNCSADRYWLSPSGDRFSASTFCLTQQRQATQRYGSNQVAEYVENKPSNLFYPSNTLVSMDEQYWNKRQTGSRAVIQGPVVKQFDYPSAGNLSSSSSQLSSQQSMQISRVSLGKKIQAVEKFYNSNLYTQLKQEFKILYGSWSSDIETKRNYIQLMFPSTEPSTNHHQWLTFPTFENWQSLEKNTHIMRDGKLYEALLLYARHIGFDLRDNSYGGNSSYYHKKDKASHYYNESDRHLRQNGLDSIYKDIFESGQYSHNLNHITRVLKCVRDWSRTDRSENCIKTLEAAKAFYERINFTIEANGNEESAVTKSVQNYFNPVYQEICQRLEELSPLARKLQNYSDNFKYAANMGHVNF